MYKFLLLYTGMQYLLFIYSAHFRKVGTHHLNHLLLPTRLLVCVQLAPTQIKWNERIWTQRCKKRPLNQLCKHIDLTRSLRT